VKLRAGILSGAAALLLAAAPFPAAAQFAEDLEETRPEAWAMRWFAGIATPTSFGVQESRDAGSWEIGLEAGLVPSLSEDERRVGFSGTKVEDLNRAPVFARPVLRVQLPAAFSLSAGWVPPVDLDGVEANILSVGVARPFWVGTRSRVGGQLSYLTGDVEGDISCPADEVAAGDDPVGNPFLCEEVSDDRFSLDAWTVELAYSLSVSERVGLFFSVLWQNLDSEFQVRALYDGFEDNSLLLFEGDSWAGTLGLSWAVAERWRLDGSLYYSPLDVIRDPTGVGPEENDALFNGRLMLSYRIR
jgi:hypothetical protein